MQIELGLARVIHGDPSEILAEPNDTSGFGAQDVGVEGKGFVRSVTQTLTREILVIMSSCYDWVP